MPRPRKSRYIETEQPAQRFKPCIGARLSQNATTLFLDELEAIRLGDLEGLSQEDAASKMEISRSTFSRLINEAHRKIADALLFSKPIVTEGGAQQASEKRIFRCMECAHEWEMDFGVGCPGKCPLCEGTNFHRTNCGRRYQRQGECGGNQRPKSQARCCGKTED